MSSLKHRIKLFLLVFLILACRYLPLLFINDPLNNVLSNFVAVDNCVSAGVTKTDSSAVPRFMPLCRGLQTPQ